MTDLSLGQLLIVAVVALVLLVVALGWSIKR